MLNYNAISKIFNYNENTATYLDAIYSNATESYDALSRLSVILIKDNQASNYFLRDRLDENYASDFFVAKLSQYKGLEAMKDNHEKRIVGDITTLRKNSRTEYLLAQGHRSSFTYPLTFNGETLAMIFFNASEVDFFTSDKVQNDMLFLCTLIHSLMINQFESEKFINISLAIALDMGHAKDPETKEHLKRMERYSSKLAYLLTKNNKTVTHEFIRRIEAYAAFHDIGKYKIPDDILFSHAIYNDEQRAVMNTHCQHGFEIINNALQHYPEEMRNAGECDFLKNVILHHHERFDGKGYPVGLKGEDIPLEARVVMVTDVFDALLSKRLYKNAWHISDVIAFFKANSGSLFDPSCVALLLEHIDEFIEIYDLNSDKAKH